MKNVFKSQHVCNNNFQFKILKYALNFIDSRKKLNVLALGLKDLKIFVPEAVIMGNAATLTCQYDLDNVRKKYDPTI